VTNSPGTITTNNTVVVTTNTFTPMFGTIDPVALTFSNRFVVPDNLHGLMYAAQDENWGPTLFYSIRQPGSGADTFDTITGGGVVTPRYNLSLTNYDALTMAAPDVGYGSINFYYVRHENNGVTHFGEIIAQGASSDADLWIIPGTGYVGLAFAAANLGYNADMFYYVGNDAAGLSTFGTINPTPGGIATNLYTVGTNFDSLVFVPSAVSTWGTGIFAYLRHDNIGSILGTIDPVTTNIIDRMSFGTNFLSAVTFTATDVGYGANLFYYLSAGSILTTNIVTTYTTNTVTTYTTNSIVTFTTTNTVTATGMDICQGGTVTATGNCPIVVTPASRPMFVAAPIMPNGCIGLCFPTQNGKWYTVQYKNKLTDPTWTDLETVLGTGGIVTITDPSIALQPMRFYRIMATP
jgi:hypothetical protein